MTTDIDLPRDSRTKAQKIGDAPSKQVKSKNNPLVLTGLGGKVAKTAPLNAASKAKRNQARDLALDYAESAILAAVDIMKTAQSEQAKVAAIRLIVEYGLGKPSTVHVDQDGNQLLPNLIIMTGNTAPMITTQYSISADGDDDQEES